MKTLSQIREASGGKEAYQKFFNSLLKKFGVDSPSELEGKKKKDFFDAIDKGWEGSGEKDESTIVEKTKLKAGKGKTKINVDITTPDDYMDDGGDKAYAKDMKKKYKIIVKHGKPGQADISGNKADILKWLASDDYYMDDSDIEALFPEVLESSDDFKSDEDESDDKGNYSGVDEASRYSRDLRGPAKQIFLKTLEKIRKEKIRGDKDQAAAVDDIDGAQHLNGRDKRTIAMALQYEAHNKDDDEDMDDLDPDTTTDVDEKAPPGMEAVVKKLKQDHSDEEAFAIAWSIHNKKENQNEGTWHLPSDKGVAAKFKKVMSKPIKLGKNGEDAIDSIENFIGDDSLFDDLNDAGAKNPKGDARKIITKHMKTLNINPKTFHWAGQESIEALGEAKISPALLKKASAIAKKNSGDMQKAIKLIDKLKRGLSDTPEVMDILKKANEDLDLQKTGDTGSSKSVEETVDVDRRTLGFKAAMVRAEKAKKVREKSKLKKEKKKEQEVLDARYEYDGEVDTVLAAANKKIFGVGEDAAANANASAGVDMAPNAGKKKKDKFKVIKRPNY